MPSGASSGAIRDQSSRRNRRLKGAVRNVKPRRMFDAAMLKTASRWPEKSHEPALWRRVGRSRRSEGTSETDTGGLGAGDGFARAAHGGGGQRLLDQHDRDVRDDRVDQARRRAVEPLRDHG